MHDCAFCRRWFSLTIVGLTAAMLLGGCLDMPRMEDEAVLEAPKIVLGPYLANPTPDGIELRFRTNRRTTAGLRFSDSGRLYRFASGDYDHAIHLTHLDPGKPRRCRVWLDDRAVEDLTIRAPAQPGAPVTLAFIGGAGADPDSMRGVRGVLSGREADGLIVVDDLFGRGGDIEAWRTTVFEPLGSVLHQTPLYFPPGGRGHVPGELFPLKEVENVVWRRQIGCVYLLGVKADLLRSKREARTILEWLAKALAARPASARWTVLLLSEPMFAGKNVNARLMQTFGDMLERAGVHLVISGGARTYHRAVPLTADGRGPVRYVTTAGLGPRETIGAGREFTATQSDQGHVCVLSADETSLNWNAVAFGGRRLDAFALTVEGESDTGEPVIEKQAILTDALAVSTLRREVLAIGRQAARAVPDPTKPQTIFFRVRNPSTNAFAGELVWDIPADTAYTITPSNRSFDLPSGKAALLEFRIAQTPAGRAWPTLLVDAPEVGYLRRSMLITQQKRADVPIVKGEVRVDGRFNDDSWKNAAELSGFSVLHSDAKPVHVVRCSIMAIDQGLAIGMRCEAERPPRIKTTATRHDAPVHEDESVEIFVDPSRQGREYLQFAANVRNVTLDRSSQRGLEWNPPWSSRVRFGRTADEVEYYNVEVLIPYRSLGLAAPPQAGESWGLNLVRNDYSLALRKDDKDNSVPESEIVQWAPTYGSNGRSGCYGVITFTRK